MIDLHFAHATVLDVVRSLDASGDPFAQQMRKRSPLMLEVTLSQLRRT